MKQLNVQAPDTLIPLPDSLTVCATIDESGAEQEITELMIRRACEQMDADQLWPYASDTLCRVSTTLPAGGARILPFRLRASH